MRQEYYSGVARAGNCTGRGFQDGKFVMKVDKDAVGPKRELIMMLKVAGTVAVVLSFVAGLFAAVEIRGDGPGMALQLFSLTLQLFFAGMMMLAVGAGLEILSGVRAALSDEPIDTRRYGRTRSNKGSLLAAKLAAEPAAH